MPVGARVHALEPLKRRILQRADEIAATVSHEVGKPEEEALLAEVLPNADLVAYWLDEIETLLEPDEQHYNPVTFPGKDGKVLRDPRGVIALITPWNYPVAIPLRTLVPALLAGNAVIFKPSEVTPRSGALVASLFEGLLPYGVLTLLQGDRDVGKALLRHPLDLVVFTGSVRGGREVAMACAERLTPCSLELGGKDAALVLADADLERAARGVVWGAFTNAGQNCASIERVYVESTVAEPFLRRVTELTVGLRPGLDTGRLTTAAQLAIVSEQVRQAIASGAEVLAGGVDPEPGSLAYPPTVLRVHDERTPLMIDETFGPVLPVVVVGSADEAVARANQCRYGLTASIWSRHRPRAEALAQQLRVGVVTINNHGFSAAIPSAPWSGHGETGHGITNGPLALAELTRPRFILTDRNGAKQELWWYPYTPTLRQVARSMATLRGGSFFERIKALFSLLAGFPRRLAEQNGKPPAPPPPALPPEGPPPLAPPEGLPPSPPDAP
jgi:acyl-CoA reductase-like NAD-dependent aldehyde dehydrogenase